MIWTICDIDRFSIEESVFMVNISVSPFPEIVETKAIIFPFGDQTAS